MSVFNLALQARVLCTSRIRRATLQATCDRSAAPMFVPFYHRVADTHPNDWTITREAFRRHVEYCCEHFEPVGLDEVQRRVSQQDSPRPTITFTFDDGYAENCDYALPLLVEKKIPTVYFVTTQFTRQQSAFPHDIKRGVKLPVNTVAQLREMSTMGIELGVHTIDHCDFAKLHSADEVRRQIIDAKDELEQMVGHSVRYFAFPYGLPQQLTQAAIEAVHESGMKGFCSAYGAYNIPGRDSFHIRRFHGDPQFWRFRNWLSFDPCKVASEPDVRYFLPPSTSYTETLHPSATSAGV